MDLTTREHHLLRHLHDDYCEILGWAPVTRFPLSDSVVALCLHGFCEVTYDDHMWIRVTNQGCLALQAKK